MTRLSRGLLDNLVVAMVVTKLSAFCGTPTLMTVFIKAFNCILSHINSFHTYPSSSRKVHFHTKLPSISSV